MVGLSTFGHSAPLNDEVRQSIEESLVMTALMTGGNTIQLGLLDFDPNEVTGLNDDALGNDASLTRRSQLSLFSLPYSTTLSEEDAINSISVQAKLAYLNQREEVFLSSNTSRTDTVETAIGVASLGIQWQHYFNAQWYAQTSANAYVMEFRNDTEFRTPESRALRTLTDGLVTNVRTHAWLLEPSAGVGYDTNWSGMRTSLHSTLHYLHGGDINADISAHEVRPEAWYWSNGVRALQPAFGSFARKHTMMYQLAQINVGGDLDQPVGSPRYYELGIGWFVDTSDLSKWVKNAGISALINYGSDLRGGTIALLYNVE